MQTITFGPVVMTALERDAFLAYLSTHEGLSGDAIRQGPYSLRPLFRRGTARYSAAECAAMARRLQQFEDQMAIPVYGDPVDHEKVAALITALRDCAQGGQAMHVKVSKEAEAA